MEQGESDLWITLTDKAQVEEYLKAVIRVIHDQGFFVSGEIRIDDKRTCPNCGFQMSWIASLGKHECRKCMEKVVQAFGNQVEERNPNLESAYSGADTKICDSCGNIAIRSGTCYTCQTCGMTSGCG